jgi:hypothetical protein
MFRQEIKLEEGTIALIRLSYHEDIVDHHLISLKHFLALM